METNQLFALAQVVLPNEMLEYFEVVGVETTPTEIHIRLDERNREDMVGNENIESKGFMAEVSVTDFPIRDHKVLLKIRRRRWLDKRTGESFSLPIQMEVTASGTRYSKEFGAFLKETYGGVPSDLPYA